MLDIVVGPYALLLYTNALLDGFSYYYHLVLINGQNEQNAHFYAYIMLIYQLFEHMRFYFAIK